MLQYEELDASEGIDIDKIDLSKNVSFVTIVFLKILDLNLKSMFVMDAIIF